MSVSIIPLPSVLPFLMMPSMIERVGFVRARLVQHQEADLELRLLALELRTCGTASFGFDSFFGSGLGT